MVLNLSPIFIYMLLVVDKCSGLLDSIKRNLQFIYDQLCTEVILLLVLLLGIFRRAPRPSATRGHPCALLLPRGHPAPKKNTSSRHQGFYFSWGTLPLKKINLLVIYDTSSIRERPKVS
jgi:hypothetical protein